MRMPPSLLNRAWPALVIAAALATPAAPAPACSTKADTVVVNSGGRGIAMGEILMGMGERPQTQTGPKTVHIWRDIPAQSAAAAKKHGVVVGKAYLERANGTLQYVCDVDLKLSDKELAKVFGVQVK